MSKYIDAEKLIAAIERLIKVNKKLKSNRFIEGIAAGYGDVLSAITSLQQEQPEPSNNLVDVDAVREDFITEVYRVLDADPTNDRANAIINAFDSLPTVSQEQPEVSAKHGWVARDKNNDLQYFSVKPVRTGVKWWDRDYPSMEVDGSLFGELSWEDEPIEVELFIREFGENARKEGKK